VTGAGPATLLELKAVDKSFGGLRVIADLDLTVKEHEIVSVIGPNGAGKTTLFNLITGIYRPTRIEGGSRSRERWRHRHASCFSTSLPPG